MFLQMLPTDFTKQDAVKSAEVRGVPQKTREDWLRKSIKLSNIERIAHRLYKKIANQSA